jgi:ribulose-phosphate 3-epimerase
MHPERPKGNFARAGSCPRVKIFHSKSLRENRLIELAPSILSADFARLAEEVAPVLAAGATVLHVDVMDGHFVPNITIGPPVVAALRKHVQAPLDVHLMIENADNYIPAFVDAGASWISVHQEACVHLDRVVEHIRSRGALAGVVLNPATPVATLTDILDVVDYVLIMSVNPGFGGQKFIRRTLGKIRHLAELRAQRNLSFRIEVDGGIALDTITDVVQAGAEILVAGNAVFGRGDSGHNVQQLLQAARSATMQKA